MFENKHSIVKKGDFPEKLHCWLAPSEILRLSSSPNVKELSQNPATGP